MEEYYRAIQSRIKEAGYKDTVDGEEIYNEICDQIEDKEPGSYVFMSKKTDQVYYEYHIDVMEDQFNLSSILIHTPSRDYKALFD